MYDLNYTFLTELEVDTRQSYDDLSDDLLLLDKDHGEESQVVDMSAVVSSWQNFFWKSSNPNKQRLDVTFTDISIEHGIDLSTDYFGAPLDDLEMMTARELDTFFSEVTNWGQSTDRRTWEELSNELCDAISALQDKYTDPNHIYPLRSVLVTNEDPNGKGFGRWTSYTNCYLSEIFSKSNYDIEQGYNDVGQSINDLGLDPTTNSVPDHTHKMAYIPGTGSGGESSEGTAEPAIVTFCWTNARRGLDPTYIGSITSQRGPHGVINSKGIPRYKYSGRSYDKNKWYYTATVMKDANTSIGDEGEAGARFTVSSAKVDAVDNKIKVAPSTYPLSSLIWERTGD